MQAKKAAKGEHIEGSIKRRDEAFEAEGGKGKGRVLASIFRIVKEHQTLQWVRNEEGELASEPGEVKRVVKEFFQSWMASKVSAQSRWGGDCPMKAWKRMQALDTSLMPKRYKDFVKECYMEPRTENREKVLLHNIFKGIKDEITIEDLVKAIKRSPAKSAAGPSRVGNLAFQMLGEEGLEGIRALFNRCLKENTIPNCINTATMCLLPKTEAGLDDLNKVRPIALMET